MGWIAAFLASKSTCFFDDCPTRLGIGVALNAHEGAHLGVADMHFVRPLSGDLSQHLTCSLVFDLSSDGIILARKETQTGNRPSAIGRLLHSGTYLGLEV